MYDVIVVGGSYAGMAAALQLARGRRNVAVIDAGVRRNRFANASHGLLGQDGIAPTKIASNAREQLLTYPNLTWFDTSATCVENAGGEFTVQTKDDHSIRGKRLVLATGVRDELPDIAGLSERWGKSVFHCPYCHGYELDNGRLGVLATGETSIHQALLIPDWGTTTLFTNGALELDRTQIDQLRKRNVQIEREPVSAVSGEHASIYLRDGRVIELAGLFVASRVEAANPLINQLGCELIETPLGRILSTNEMKETSVAGVYACGDVTRAAGNVTFALADGVMAGTAAHRSLIFEDLG